METELVVSGEYLPHNLWVAMFSSSQGYLMKKNIIYQYNKRENKIEINGCNSCMENYRHVRLVSYYTLHKGTSKCHKTYEKSTHFAVHNFPSIFDLFTIPLHPTLFQKHSGLIYKNSNVDG